MRGRASVDARRRLRVPKVAGRLRARREDSSAPQVGATSGPGSLDRPLGRGARISTLRRWTGSTGRPSRGSRATPRGSSPSLGRKTRACRRIRRLRTHHRHEVRAPGPSSALARGLVLPDPDSWHPLRRFVGLTPRALNLRRRKSTSSRRASHHDTDNPLGACLDIVTGGGERLASACTPAPASVAFSASPSTAERDSCRAAREAEQAALASRRPRRFSQRDSVDPREVNSPDRGGPAPPPGVTARDLCTRRRGGETRVSRRRRAPSASASGASRFSRVGAPEHLLRRRVAPRLDPTRHPRHSLRLGRRRSAHAAFSRGGATTAESLLETLGLPPDVVRYYRDAKRIERLYPWRLAGVPSLEGVFDPRANLVYCAPTSGCKSLVSDVLGWCVGCGGVRGSRRRDSSLRVAVRRTRRRPRRDAQVHGAGSAAAVRRAGRDTAPRGRSRGAAGAHASPRTMSSRSSWRRDPLTGSSPSSSSTSYTWYSVPVGRAHRLASRIRQTRTE